jgi:hypothetical protein
LFRDAGRGSAPALFLYAERDSFYDLAFSRSNFEAFRDGGGQGQFVEFVTPPGINGHGLHLRPQQWQQPVHAFLTEHGLNGLIAA